MPIYSLTEGALNSHKISYNSVEKSTIFDNVSFLDEGAAISIALGAGLLGVLGLAYAAIYNSDPDVIDNRNIKKALKQYCQNHKDVQILDKFVSKVVKINITDLIDNSIVDKDDAKLIRSKPVVAYAMYDRKNNIIAYALFLYTLKDGYCYKLCDKSYGNSREIHNYVKAQFEFATRSYGAGLMSIMSYPPGYMTGGITRRKLTYLNTDKDPYPLSRFEYNKIMSDMLKIGGKLEDCLNQIKSKYNNYFGDSVVEMIDVRDQRQNSSANPYIIYELLSSEIFDPDDVVHMCNLIKDALKGIGFYDIECTYSDANREKGKHSISTDVSDKYTNMNVSIVVYNIGEIAVYVSYSRPISIK